MQIPKISLWICALALGGVIAIRAEDTAAQAAARAAMLEKMQELQGGSATAPQTPAPAESAPAAVTPAPEAPPAAAPAETAAPAAATAAPVETPADSTIMSPAITQPGDSEAQARARAALNEKMSALGSPVAPAQASNTQASVTPASPAPIVAPPLPINFSKEQKLDWLLNLYKANQITPQQYHEQRAAILAGK
jgi:hypothetical protein